MDLIFYNVWKAMAIREDAIQPDKEYWHSTGLVNYDFAPIVKLNIIKKAFSRLIFFILKRIF